MLHPHKLQYATPTNKQEFKYMLYLYFALILVTILNLCSALKFRTYICVYTKSLPCVANVRAEQSYVHKNQCTQILNLLSPVYKTIENSLVGSYC